MKLYLNCCLLFWFFSSIDLICCQIESNRSEVRNFPQILIDRVNRAPTLDDRNITSWHNHREAASIRNFTVLKSSKCQFDHTNTHTHKHTHLELSTYLFVSQKTVLSPSPTIDQSSVWNGIGIIQIALTWITSALSDWWSNWMPRLLSRPTLSSTSDWCLEQKTERFYRN